jgi:hypothetical protein
MERAIAAGKGVPGKPFTDPCWTTADLATLRELAARITDCACEPSRRDGWSRWRDDVADYLLLVPSWERLDATSEADGVGFFGQLRPNPGGVFPPHLERSVADAGGRDGWLLAYCNARFRERESDGAPRNANLVVITSRAAAGSLAHEADHIEAVGLSPNTYRSIRIHRLSVGGSPTCQSDIRVRETLYVDFAQSPPWRAVRRMAEPLR